MNRFLMLVTISIACVPFAVNAQEEPKKDEKRLAAKSLAEKLAQATQGGDHETIVNLTYKSVLKKLGGKEQAKKAIEAQMQQLDQGGAKIESFKVGDPGKLHYREKRTFVVIPTKTSMSMQQLKLSLDSYLLGISEDEGKTWTFIDGSAIGSREQLEEIVPPLPEKLQLPKVKPPTIDR